MRWMAVLLGFAGICGLHLSETAPVRADELSSWIDNEMDSLAQLYVHLHRHPELSLHEQQTAARIAEEFRLAGYDVTTGVGGHGVVGVLKNGDGKVLMLRADLDALPVREQTGVEYASAATAELDGQPVGVMHACGHDMHMTNLVGVGRYLAQHRDDWKGTLILLGQPAEERGDGAKSVLADGLYQRFPQPDFAIALHVDSGMAAGKVGYRPGAVLANVDSVDIVMKGRGGHGSAPEKAIDPVLQAAELVVALQSIISREIDPQAPAVITVGSIHGGSQHNIISSECRLQLTVRSYSDDVRAHLEEAIRRKAKSIAMAARAPEPEIVYSEGTPAVLNDEDLTARVAASLQQAVGVENVSLVSPVMGGEDFSRYGRAGVPICLYRLGAVEQRRLDQFESAGTPPPSLHSPFFYPDFEPTLQTGVRTMTQAALDLLAP